MDVKRQYFAAFVSLLCTIFFGACEGFSSILISQLEKPDSPILISNEEASWIASTFLLPGPLGSLTVGILMEIYGRKKIVQLTYLPLLLGWAVISQADSVMMICIGRLMNGFALGMEASAIVYASEVMLHPFHRSILLTFISPAFYLGMALTYFVGYFLPWRQEAICMSALGALSFLLVFIIPETPSWLITRNKIKECTNSLQWLTNNSVNVDEELAKLKGADVCKIENTTKESFFKSVMETGAWKPFLIIVIFILLQQFSGYKILVFYTVSFYDSFGTEIDSYLSSIIFALITVLTSFLLTIVINLVNRKTLMMISCIGIGVLCSTAAAYSYYFENVENKPLFWLPVACIWINVMFSTLGLNTLTWIMAGELFPRKVRGTMVGLVWAAAFFIMFISVKMHPTLLSIIRVYGMLTIFAVFAFIAAICSIFMLPETRGKTLREIEELWLPKTKKAEIVLVNS